MHTEVDAISVAMHTQVTCFLVCFIISLCWAGKLSICLVIYALLSTRLVKLVECLIVVLEVGVCAHHLSQDICVMRCSLISQITQIYFYEILWL